jgi:hypothetical protein
VCPNIGAVDCIKIVEVAGDTFYRVLSALPTIANKTAIKRLKKAVKVIF